MARSSGLVLLFLANGCSGNGFDCGTNRLNIPHEILGTAPPANQEILAVFDPYLRRGWMAEKAQWTGASGVCTRLKDSDQISDRDFG